jgi:hypothetical protein
MEYAIFLPGGLGLEFQKKPTILFIKPTRMLSKN